MCLVCARLAASGNLSVVCGKLVSSQSQETAVEFTPLMDLGLGRSWSYRLNYL